jgi:hypothetical protein
VWSYSPSTRRVKRLTAANRSDATLGTEFTQDDGTPSYNGKVEMMNWKYVGKGRLIDTSVTHAGTSGKMIMSRALPTTPSIRNVTNTKTYPIPFSSVGRR